MGQTVGRAAIGATSLLLTASVGLTGCGDAPEASPSDPPSTARSTRPTTMSPPHMRTPPPVANAHGALADLGWDPAACTSSPGVQKVAGTVTNPTRARTDYVITINWTNATYDVLGRGFAVVRAVGPGKRVAWSLTGRVAAGATMCVPHVERGTVAGA